MDNSNIMTEKWKNLSRTYNLLGDHIMTNEVVVKDEIKTFGLNGKFVIPRYALVDREGNIRVLELNAADMTDFEPLRKELEKIR